MAGEFKSARLKVRRAEKHIANLKRLIDEFTAAEGHRVASEYEAFSDTSRIRFQSNEQIPDDINLVFGDAAHCLRVAFDHALFAVVKRLNPAAVDKDIQFGIHATRVGAEGVLKNTKAPIGIAFTTPLGDKIQNTLLDFMYPNGAINEGFSDLHKLDLIDKHRLLITCAYLGGLGIDQISLVDKSGRERQVMSGLTIMHQRHPESGVLKVHGGKIKAKVQPCIEVRTNEIDLRKNDSVLGSLEQAAKFVSEAIDLIERCVNTHGGFPP